MVEKSKKKAVYKNTKKMMEESYRALDMEKFQTRRWKDGDIYSPHDLSHEEMEKWKKPKRVTVDAFDTLGINPLHEYKVSQSIDCRQIVMGSKFEADFPDSVAEFCHNVGVYVFYRSYPTEKGDGFTACESKACRKGDSQGGGHGFNTQCA